jgi:sigma-70-like protein
MKARYSEAVLEMFKTHGELTPSEIGMMFGLSVSSVERIMNKAGMLKDAPRCVLLKRLQFRKVAERTRRQKRNVAIVKMARDATLSNARIGEHFGVSAATVGLVLRRAGRKRRVGRKRGATAEYRNSNRDASVRRMRNSGMTLQSIGKQLGLSRQRIHQILNHTRS